MISFSSTVRRSSLGRSKFGLVMFCRGSFIAFFLFTIRILCIILILFYRRYSHTSHIIDDNYLVLVGGANYYEIPPGICIIDLVNLKAFEFRLPVLVVFILILFDFFLVFFLKKEHNFVK